MNKQYTEPLSDASIANVLKEKIYTLDFLRVMVVFLVFLFHSNMHIGVYYGFLTPFISQGAIAMVAFFMLSGFTLYYNYYDRDLLIYENLKKFYIKRLLNIYPLYLSVYIIWLLLFNTLSIKMNLLIAPIELLLLQSFFDNLFSYLHNGGTWFVSCIFFCYLIFPFLKNILVQKKTYRKLLFLFLYLVCSLAPVIVIKFDQTSIYANPFFRSLEFFMGMIVASLFINSKSINNKFVCVCVMTELTILIVGITFFVKNQIAVNNYPAYNFFTLLFFALLIYHFSKLKKIYMIKLFSNKIMQYLSKISYAFFFAQFFTWNLTKYLEQHYSWFFIKHTNIKMFATSLILCIIIAILMHEIIENPAKNFFSRKCKL